MGAAASNTSRARSIATDIYKELAGVITFLIERRHLPAFPPRLHQALRSSFTPS